MFAIHVLKLITNLFLVGCIVVTCLTAANAREFEWIDFNWSHAIRVALENLTVNRCQAEFAEDIGRWVLPAPTALDLHCQRAVDALNGGK